MEEGGGEGEEKEARKNHGMRMRLRMRWVERRRNDKAPLVAVPCCIRYLGLFLL